jgi:hypothetical protein
MGPIAERDIPLAGGALTRFGPNTTARLLEVILFKSHRSITYQEKKDVSFYRLYKVNIFIIAKYFNIPLTKTVQCI